MSSSARSILCVMTFSFVILKKIVFSLLIFVKLIDLEDRNKVVIIKVLMKKPAHIFKKSLLNAFSSLLFLGMMPGFCSAQAAVQVADSVSAEKIFLTIVNWGLIIIIVLGVILI